MKASAVKIGFRYLISEGGKIVAVRVLASPPHRSFKFPAVVQDGSGRRVQVSPQRIIQEIKQAQGPADCSPNLSNPLLK